MRRELRAILLAGVLSASCSRPAPAQQAEQARAAMRAGRYEEAISLYSAITNRPDATPAARRGLLRALSEVGRYADAEEAGRRFVASGPAPAELWNALGEVLYRRGSVREAEEAFGKALAGRASDSLVARLNLGVLRYERGERGEAMRTFAQLVDAYNRRGGRLSAPELTAVGTAARYLGGDEPQMFKDALKAYDQAAAADTVDLEPQVLAGELFLEKYNAADARETLDGVLRVNPRHPRALLGMARLRYFDGDPEAAEFARRSLAVNPNLVEARAYQAMLLLDSEDYAQAAAEAERALAVDSASLDALSVLAAARYLRGDRAGYEAARRRALARNPRAADLYNTLAELSARNRLYREAAEFARQAVALDSTSWHAFGLLGMNQLRVGAIEDGRKNLEIAFKGDPYHVWIKNTLDLLDTFKDYAERPSGKFQFVIEKKDADLLALYLGELLDSAYARLAERYGYRPPTPIRLELYRSHADFSVRTAGLPGLGALGVSFGTVLAMDSPAARDLGRFNWGSTAWHELAHTFTLGMTNHRVPRWLSEGISVYEERRARPGWGADVSPGFLAAYKAGRLPPPSRLNDGFMRPSYPEQIVHAYYMASLVVEMIERDGGPRALPDLLRGYADGQATEQIVQRVLKTDLKSFDAKFDAYVRQRFARQLAAVGDWALGTGDSGRSVRQSPVPGPQSRPNERDFGAQLAMGRALAEQGKRDEAIPYLERAKALFPEYAGDDSPYALLAAIYKAKGMTRQAADELARLTLLNESAYDANLELAGLLEQLGDRAGAAAALDRAIYISPFDAAVHQRLAAHYSALGDRARAVRERRAVVALDPVDRAEALYQLAVAYHEAGDATSARRAVLQALEGAPNFDKAQELLLKLQPTGGRP